MSRDGKIKMKLYLVLNKAGQLEHMLSDRPEKDFAGLQNFGESPKDAEGKIESTEWLDLVSGRPVVNAAKKTEITAQVAAAKAAERAARLSSPAARANFKALSVDALTTIAGIKGALKIWQDSTKD